MQYAAADVRDTPERDGYAFTVVLPTRDGRRLRVTGRARFGPSVSGEVGWSLRKFARGVARSKAFRSVMKIARSPLVSSLLPPGIGVALKVADRASRAIAGARRGDPGARAALARAAATGNPAVLEGLRVAAAAGGVRLRFRGQAPAGRRAIAAARRPVGMPGDEMAEG